MHHLLLLLLLLFYLFLPTALGQKSIVLADSFFTPGERIDLSVLMTRQGFVYPDNGMFHLNNRI